jgi:hypothetical protein
MRTFAQKERSVQQTRSAGSTSYRRASPALHEWFKADSARTASNHWGYHFSHVSVHSRVDTQIQPKLAISTPGDRAEQEANHVVEQVMQMTPQREQACPCGGGCPRCQANEGNPKREQTERAQAGNPGGTVVSPLVQAVLRAPGQPMDSATRSFFEPRFGYGFGDVRFHTGARAAEAAQALGAKAFTIGRNVVFGADLYQPGTSAGKRLLAHELVHVVQQQRGGGALVQRQVEELPTPVSPVHRCIDVRAQFALQRLWGTKPADANARDAVALFNAVDDGQILGIFGDDLGISATIAAQRDPPVNRWELVTEGQVELVRDPPQPPAVIFRAGAEPGELDVELVKEFRKNRDTLPAPLGSPQCKIPAPSPLPEDVPPDATPVPSCQTDCSLDFLDCLQQTPQVEFLCGAACELAFEDCKAEGWGTSACEAQRLLCLSTCPLVPDCHEELNQCVKRCFPVWRPELVTDPLCKYVCDLDFEQCMQEGRGTKSCRAKLSLCLGFCPLVPMYPPPGGWPGPGTL